MDILTKICVVVLVVLVLFGTAVFITAAMVPESYRFLHEQESQRRKLVDQQYRNMAVAYTRAQTSLNREIGDHNTEVHRLSTALAEKTAEVVARDNTITLFHAEIAKLKAQQGRFNVKTDEFLLRTKEAQEQLAVALTRVDALTQENTRLDSELRKKEIESESTIRLARFLKEQNIELKQRIDDLESGPVAARGTDEVPHAAPGADVVVVGKVFDVEHRYGLASINVGSAKGVCKGMRLVISRDGKFVGYIVIESVELDKAAGVIKDKQIDPRKGDKVESQASLSAE